MHQANGDTRLCTACIDHVDLVAVGRAVLRETGRKDLKLGGKRRGGSPPLPPRALHRLSSSSGHGCTLAESTDVRTERDREERERERERAERVSEIPAPENTLRAYRQRRVSPSIRGLYVYARVFFQRDLLPNS